MQWLSKECQHPLWTQFLLQGHGKWQTVSNGAYAPSVFIEATQSIIQTIFIINVCVCVCVCDPYVSKGLVHKARLSKLGYFSCRQILYIILHGHLQTLF